MPVDRYADKWACEPCVRGHRSTKCSHFDRIMIRVKKPGRPLSSCPHPGTASCSCKNERVFMVKIRLAPDGTCLCAPLQEVMDEQARIAARKAEFGGGPTPPPSTYPPSFPIPAPDFHLQHPPMARLAPPIDFSNGFTPVPGFTFPSSSPNHLPHPPMGQPNGMPQMPMGHPNSIPHSPPQFNGPLNLPPNGSQNSFPGFSPINPPHGLPNGPPNHPPNGLPNGLHAGPPNVNSNGANHSLSQPRSTLNSGFPQSVSSPTVPPPDNESPPRPPCCRPASEAGNAVTTQHNHGEGQSNAGRGMSVHSQNGQDTQRVADHSICTCGPECNCSFCPVHPHNNQSQDEVEMLAGALDLDLSTALDPNRQDDDSPRRSPHNSPQGGVTNDLDDAERWLTVEYRWVDGQMVRNNPTDGGLGFFNENHQEQAAMPTQQSQPQPQPQQRPQQGQPPPQVGPPPPTPNGNPHEQVMITIGPDGIHRFPDGTPVPPPHQHGPSAFRGPLPFHAGPPLVHSPPPHLMNGPLPPMMHMHPSMMQGHPPMASGHPMPNDFHFMPPHGQHPMPHDSPPPHFTHQRPPPGMAWSHQ